ncbi:MAG: thioredoxin family protein [Paracoccaceae bacterium]
MRRRDFLALTATVSLALATGLRAEDVVYTPGLVAERLAKGETLFVDFYASWCSTCAAQHRAIDAIRAENPAYEKAITFVTVDWDTYQDDKLTRGLKIPRRSTLVVLKGDKELGRIVAGTSRDEIKALMDKALGAAGA